jgi:hypothetical protein
MFGLFRKRGKDPAPVLSVADQAICDELEVASAEWRRAYEGRERRGTVLEVAHDEAVYQLSDKRYDAARRAHKEMMKRLTAEARARLEAQDPRP